jgi:hypothetical protein
LALTKDDGSEAQEVVYIERDEKGAVDGLAAQLQAILGVDRRLGIAALSKVVWRHFGKK